MVALGWGAEIADAVDSILDIEAKPTIAEGLSKTTVKRTLMKIDDASYWVKDANGREFQLHVDVSTKRDKVMAGDKVKSYIAENEHTTTLSTMNDLGWDDTRKMDSQ